MSSSSSRMSFSSESSDEVFEKPREDNFMNELNEKMGSLLRKKKTGQTRSELKIRTKSRFSVVRERVYGKLQSLKELSEDSDSEDDNDESQQHIVKENPNRGIKKILNQYQAKKTVKTKMSTRSRKKKDNSDSPQTLSVTQPIYTYCRIFKPRKASPKVSTGWSTPKNPLKLSEFSKSEPSPVAGISMSVLSTPQRKDPDWLLYKTPEAQPAKKRKPTQARGRKRNESRVLVTARGARAQSGARSRSPLRKAARSSSSSSPIIRRKKGQKSRAILKSSSSDGDNKGNGTEPITEPSTSKKASNRIQDCVSHLSEDSDHAEELELLPKPSRMIGILRTGTSSSGSRSVQKGSRGNRRGIDPQM